ncbi:deoxyribose-phosphate aldolase [Waterburya agarophytonicola K14]|uniref:Deoxyribose-phosphate aldolase n=1 Tax=Waterburya agarophytonicola KI4 TaxID=2874699 RepID=A0A964BSY5_9CYAN|nr:deoxyribose-phosphate aldolase [Waterburya agarophytonicola]MCC0177275.1 deoxyribose-phosphate aldolase [Waterburya agarophytonicola KI4]
MPITDLNIDIATYIDHTLLKPSAIPDEIKKLCQDAWQYNFPAVCVYPVAVIQARELLHDKQPNLCTVIGFPSGAVTSSVKLYEAQEVVENGATELDVVINLGWLKSGKTKQVYEEIAQICSETGQVVKAILETTVLTNEEKILAAEICMDAGAAYLKTSTGWFGGATVEDVEILAKITKGQIGIKASGGIRTYEQAIALIQAGATRLGTSRGVDLLRQQSESIK